MERLYLALFGNCKNLPLLFCRGATTEQIGTRIFYSDEILAEK